MKTKKQIEKRIEYLREEKNKVKGTKRYDKLSKHNQKIYDDLEDDIQTLIWCLK